MAFRYRWERSKHNSQDIRAKHLYDFLFSKLRSKEVFLLAVKRSEKTAVTTGETSGESNFVYHEETAEDESRLPTPKPSRKVVKRSEILVT
jgi:hypothetical protein